MPQEIGVESIWSTKKFSPGLGVYLSGLTRAIVATNQTVATISNLGATLNNVFNVTHTNGQLAIATLNAIAAAARRANSAIVAANRRTINTRAGAASQSTANVVGANTATQINNAARATQNLGNQARSTSANLDTLTTKSIAVGTAIGTIVGNAIAGFSRGLASFGREALEIVTFFERLDLSIAFYTARNIQAENAQISFNDALAQGTKDAQGLSIWLQRLAVASPFTTRDVGVLFRTAQAYGLTRKEAELLTPLLLDFAAAAGLDERILERLALAMGQVRARGKLTGEEVRQLGNSGIPIRDILVKALGIANDEFDNLLESGALTSDVVIPAIINALKVFEGAGERVAFDTVGGIVSAFAELREIGIAKFFRGVTDAIKADFQALFAVLNQPQVLAFIQILGEEIGVKFRNAVLGVVETVNNLIAAWNALSSSQQQQIIVFTATTAGVIALVGAIGLLTIAVNLLLSPLVLLATTVGFLVSEWTSGFTVMRSITQSVVGAITRTVRSITGAIGSALSGFLGFLNRISSDFSSFVDDFITYGANIGKYLAEGIASANNALIASIRGVANIMTFWFAPGSPPRVAPKMDKWGTAAMQEFYNAFAEANPETPLNKAGQVIQKQLNDTVIKQQKALVEELNSIHPDLNLTLAQSLNEATKGAYLATQDALKDTDAVEQEASDAGIRVSEAFVNSFLDRLPDLQPRVSEELAKVLKQIGGGTFLTREGAATFNKYLAGFGDADFGILDDVSDVVRDFLQGLVDTGQIGEADLPRLLFGARENIARGIRDIREFGAVSEKTLQSIRSTAGGASQYVIQLLESYSPLAMATRDVELSQEKLNAVTEKYKAIITPLRKELEAINEANRLANEQEKILSLQRVIANQAVSSRRRANAQLEIQQILAERRVRNLETERDTATGAAKDELTAREKTRDELEKQFDALQSNIQAQLDQLGLVTRESAIVRKLQEEAAKLREKELTQDELKLKLVELQGEELADLEKAARAKYDLDRADSTELEKQQAQIDLAQVALRRRNREAEAIKLGIPVEELTKLRDFVVTLDDIGVKKKDAFSPPDTNGVEESTVNAQEITEKWEQTLAEVRDRWDEIKARIIETATAINDNLPSFLKIFPEFEGGEPPIIGFIKGYAGVVIGLAVAINTYKIVSRVVALGAAIRSLMLTGTLAGAAGAAGGAVGAAGATTGAASVIAAITTAVVTLGSAALITTGYLLALKAAIDGFQASESTRFTENTQQIERTLGDAAPGLQGITDKLIEDAGVVSPEAQKRLGENITNAATFAIQDGFGDEHVAASIAAAINRSIAEGLIADTPENRAAIAAFRTNLQAVLAGTTTGETPKLTILSGAEIEPFTDEQQVDAQDKVAGFLSGIVNENSKGTFATAVEGIVRDGTSAGLSNASIDAYVFNAFNAGVKAGLVADTPENRQAIRDYIDGLVATMKKEGEIESPSGLTQREVGMPLGMGIIAGISLAFTSGSRGIISAAKFMTKGFIDALDDSRNKAISIAEDIRDTVSRNIDNLGIALGIRMNTIRTDQNQDWTGIYDKTIETVGAMTQAVEDDFDALHDALKLKMPTIEDIVVGAFASMRLRSTEEIGGLRDDILEILATGDESLLSGLSTYFLAIDQMIADNIGLTSAAARQAFFNAMRLPYESAFGALQPSNASSVTNNNSQNVNHWNLSVNSRNDSQGIIADFGIMQTLTSGY